MDPILVGDHVKVTALRFPTDLGLGLTGPVRSIHSAHDNVGTRYVVETLDFDVIATGVEKVG